MKPSELYRCRHFINRETLLSHAIRHILIASVGAGFPVLALSSGIRPEPVAEPASPPETVRFNSAFIHGASVDVSHYQQGNPNPAGEFVVQVLVNGLNRGQHKVLFVPVKNSVSAQPCFTPEELDGYGIKIMNAPERSGKGAAKQCARLEQWVTGSAAHYNAGDFQLNLVVPQAWTVEYPRGYTDPNTWEAGTTVGLLEYNSNFYTRQNTRDFRSDGGHDISGNVGLMAGLNFYGWRLRKRINTSWDSRSSTHTQNLFTYLQRDVPVLKSQLTLGDSTTSGDLFDSLTVRGIQLQSDDRMLPEGLRYYTPVLRGIAESNARVRVTQRGQTVYETTVPPGPFALSDVGAMGYGGDLQMTIIEADGRQRTQVIPFSAPPMLLHEGVSRFGVTVGQLQDDTLKTHPGMAQGFYQYGLGSLYTLYGGGQISDNYGAVGFGHAFNTPLGGVSMDITRARSELKDGRSSTGNSFNIGFSKFLDSTSTDITLAAYRYSSKGFYSLRDAIAERSGARDDHYMVDYRTRERFTVNVGQPLWNGARINVSGNFYSYWDERGSSKQYMVSYNKSERYFSWAISASRAFDSDGRDINSVMLSFSVPLGQASIVDRPLFNTLYTTAMHDNDGGTSAQVNAIGSQGDQSELSYGVGTTVSKSRNDNTQGEFNGNMNYNSPWGQFGSTASLGSRSRQLSFTANGSVIAHSGGLTLGPRLGDAPFALIHAEGAKGARMLNGYGSRIDGNGYAVMPSLTPYRENTIAINTEGLPDTVDVLESESTVIPRMGAAIPVTMKTLIGKPAVLIIRDKQGNYLPIGANIMDMHNTSQGLIGQGGMAYIRGWHADKDSLYVKDASGARICTIYADKSIADKIARSSGAITQVGVVCH